MIVSLIEILDEISLYLIGMTNKGLGVISKAVTSPFMDEVYPQLLLSYKPAT